MSAVSATAILFCTQPAKAECAGAGVTEMTSGSVNNVFAQVEVGAWAHGSCAKFKTGNKVYEVVEMLEYKSGCSGSYAECGYVAVRLNEQYVTKLASYSGSKEGWKLKTRKGKILKLVYDVPNK